MPAAGGIGPAWNGRQLGEQQAQRVHYRGMSLTSTGTDDLRISKIEFNAARISVSSSGTGSVIVVSFSRCWFRYTVTPRQIAGSVRSLGLFRGSWTWHGAEAYFTGASFSMGSHLLTPPMALSARDGTGHHAHVRPRPVPIERGTGGRGTRPGLLTPSRDGVGRGWGRGDGVRNHRRRHHHRRRGQ